MEFITITLHMPQKRTYTDQCPEPSMAFQDLHLPPLQFKNVALFFFYSTVYSCQSKLISLIFLSLLYYYFQFNNLYYCIFVYILVIRYKFNSRCSKNDSNRNIDVSLLRYVNNLLRNELWNVYKSHVCTTLHFHLMNCYLFLFSL